MTQTARAARAPARAVVRKAPGVREGAAVRRVEALHKRIEGKTYRTIGLELEISHEQARQDVAEALAEVNARQQDAAVLLRTQEREKLDLMEENLYPHVISGRPDAILTALKIMERRARLLGLDAPQQQTVRGDVLICQYVGIDPAEV